MPERPLRNALDGTWLGAPLHPALTDVPIGATTTAVLLDAGESISGSASLAIAADRALAVGVLRDRIRAIKVAQALQSAR